MMHGSATRSARSPRSASPLAVFAVRCRNRRSGVQLLLGLSIAVSCTVSTTSCRWPELLAPTLLAEGGTYMLGATFGQLVVADDNSTSVSPGIVIWMADDNASALLSPVGGTLEWCPEPAACCLDPATCSDVRGVLRLTPPLTGEGNDPAPSEIVPQWIHFDGMDPASVGDAIEALALLQGKPPEATREAFLVPEGEPFQVNPGDRLGQAAVVGTHPNSIPPVLTRRVLLSVSAAEHVAYIDPYLFFPSVVDELILSQHQSLLGDVTPPDLSGDDIHLYPQDDGTRLEPTNPGDPIPHYNVDGVLNLAVLARDAGAGVCDGTGCTPAGDVRLGLKLITYYVTADSDPTNPVIGPVTVALRCLDAARWGWADPAQGIYRTDPTTSAADGFLYNVTAMRSLTDCGAVPEDAAALAIDTSPLANQETYTLVVVVEDYGGNMSCTTEPDGGGPSAAPMLGFLAGCSGEGAKAKFTPSRDFDLSLPRPPGAQANPYINIATIEGSPIQLNYTINNAAQLTSATVVVVRAGLLLPVATLPVSELGTGAVSWDGKDMAGNRTEGEYHAYVWAWADEDLVGMSSPVRIVLYQSWLLDHEDNPVPQQLHMMVNNDDDNLDGKLDSTAPIDPELDDDIVRIGLGLVPGSIADKVHVATADGAPPVVNAWSNHTRGADLFGLHPAQLLWLEASAPGTTTMVLRWKTKDGFDLDPHTLEIHAIRVQITNGTEPLAYLNVATWENAYVPPQNPVPGQLAWPTVRPDFIDHDPRRFFVRVEDHSLPANGENPPFAEVATFDRAGGLFGETSDIPVDDMTQVPLNEALDTPGLMVSMSQLLTANDFPLDRLSGPTDFLPSPSQVAALAQYLFTDDKFPVADGDSFVDDDQPGDRTHMVTADNGIIAVGYGQSQAKHTVPLCERGSDDKRGVVRVQVFLFNEPFFDDPAWPREGEFDWEDLNGNGRHDPEEPSELYLDLSHGGKDFLPGDHPDQDGERSVLIIGDDATSRIWRDFERARISWAPACLRIVQMAAGGAATSEIPMMPNTTFAPTPIETVQTVSNAAQWSDLLRRGDTEALLDGIAHLAGTRHASDVAMGYVGLIASEPGTEVHGRSEPGRGIFLISIDADVEERTFAHELGHILTATPEAPADAQHFYPIQWGQSWQRLYNDAWVVSTRRIALAYANLAVRFVHWPFRAGSP